METETKRRVIICGWFFFPRGGATANYIQYLGKAIRHEGYDVEIWSSLNQEYHLVDGCIYDDFKVYDIRPCSKFNVIRRLLDGKLYWMYFLQKMRALQLTRNDVVIVSPSFKGIDTLLHYKHKIGFKTIGIPLEWFGKEQYTSEKEAIKGERDFRRNNKHDLLFPISHAIQEQFPNKPSLVLPIMADTSEYEMPIQRSGKYKFILPANGLMKDSLYEILEGIGSLSSEELQRMEFHLTGVSKEKLDSVIDKTLLQKLDGTLILHSWMKYDKLVELYCKMHFLILARETNQTTFSNFPEDKVPEVMTYGVVPIVSRVGDYTQYYLEDGVNSLVFDGCDKKILAAETIEERPFLSYL